MMKHVSTTSRTLDGSRSKTNIKLEENNIYRCATQIILLSTWEFWVKDVVDHRHPKLTSQKKTKQNKKNKTKKKCKTNSQICTFVFIHESIPCCVTWCQGGVKCSLEYLEYDFSTDQINSLINHTMCQTLNI